MVMPVRPIYLTLAVLLLVTGLGERSLGQSDRAGPTIPHPEGTYLGANSCFQCHRQPLFINFDAGQMDWVLFTEFSSWRTVDKHSMAYAVLEGPRGRQMGEKLGVDVTTPEAGCLSCHAQNFPSQQLGPDFSYQDGVNCEVCHGPVAGGPQGGWLTPHQLASWRQEPPDEKAKLGLWDLRNPAVQSELCLSCHVGDADLGRVVTHPMYAAGHPPLPSIDVSRFVKNMPQHWRDKDEVPWWDEASEEIRLANGIAEEKLYQLELTMVGNIIALRDSMRLLADRADVASATPDDLHKWPELALNKDLRDDPRIKSRDRLPELAASLWPEMAMTHSDCLACHHDLRYPGWRQRRGFVAAPGRPVPRPFPTALIELNIEQYGDRSDHSEFEQLLRRLNESFTARPFGRPNDVRDAARKLAQWAADFHEERLRSASFEVDSAPVILRRLCELKAGTIHDYDTARQIASAFQVIYRDWATRTGQSGPEHDRIERILAGWDVDLNLGRYPESDRRDALSLSILQDLTDDPDLDGFGDWLPITLGYPNDPQAYWDASQNNEVLFALGQRTTPARIRDAYVSDKFKESLQEINNEGLRIALDRASQYDPYRFGAELQALNALLPPPQGQ